MRLKLIQNLKFKIENYRKGFTLIEIMVAIAIVAILSAVVLVSMKSYGVKARASKAQAQLASLLPGMIGCWGNGGNVSVPATNGTGDICSLGDSYGSWPTVGGTTDLSTYSFSSTNSSGNIPGSAWYVSLTSNWSNDRIRVCCNGVMKNCKIQNRTVESPATYDSGACSPSNPTN